MVSPAQQADAANYLVRRFKVSERRACQLVGLHRSTKRYQPLTPEAEVDIVKAMNDLRGEAPALGISHRHQADARPRAGRST